MNKFRFNTMTDIVLILLFVGAFFVLLRPFSPKSVEGDFFGVRMVPENAALYQVFGDEFGCSQIEDLPNDMICSTQFEGQTLAARIRFQDASRRFLEYCDVTYGGTAVPCDPSFTYKSPLPYVVVRDDLGVSAERYSELRAERRLLNWQSGTWTDGLWLVAVGFGVLFLVWRWVRFDGLRSDGHPIFTVLLALLTTVLAYFVAYFLTNLVISFLFDGPNAPYGLSSVIAVLATGAAIVWHWWRFQGWQPKFARLAYSLAGGTTVLTLTYFFGLLALLSLGFVD